MKKTAASSRSDRQSPVLRGVLPALCVVLAALPTGQNVYNYAARYNVGLTFARDGILLSTLTSPIFIAIVAALLS